MKIKILKTKLIIYNKLMTTYYDEYMSYKNLCNSKRCIELCKKINALSIKICKIKRKIEEIERGNNNV